MDKNEFGSYEYLPTNPVGAESAEDQFFVVQDDGTYLLNRQVQYVAQVQDVKATLDGAQACTVYDVNPQQFFVDVPENSTELISVADNYILPPPEADESNNIYSNSFLLQAVSAESSEQAEKDLTVAVQLKEPDPEQEVDLNIINNVNKQGSNYTEITLTDEQYKYLEQKGWVLLDTNEKVFILDTFGLHDITTNHDLIQNLKAESKIDSSLKVDTTVIARLDKENDSDLKLEIIDKQDPSQQETNVDSRMEDTDIAVLSRLIIKNDGETSTEKQNDAEEHSAKVENISQQETSKLSTVRKDGDTIKIKTKYYFKDIPDKIVLGKTLNGKKLVAKVVKKWPRGCQPEEDSGEHDQLEPSNNRPDTEDSAEDDQTEPTKNKPETAIEKVYIASIIRKFIRTANIITDVVTFGITEEMLDQRVRVLTLICSCTDYDSQSKELFEQALCGNIKSSAGAVAAAIKIITQLSQVPDFKCTVDGRNVIITKVLEKTCNGETTRSSSFVTGVVKFVEGQSSCFNHIPDLLEQLVIESRDPKPDKSSNRSLLKREQRPDSKIMQIHISETRCDGVESISVILNDLLLPSLGFDESKKPDRLHACSSCAVVFESEAELMDHQENHSIEAEGALTIDTDKLPKESIVYNMAGKYLVVKTDKGTEYGCILCPKRFNRLTNCIRHKKTHVKERRQSIADTDPPYKCHMCSSSYYYSSSLTKHITRVHILKDKVNKGRRLIRGPYLVSWRH